jgi:hypothetical protein
MNSRWAPEDALSHEIFNMIHPEWECVDWLEQLYLLQDDRPERQKITEVMGLIDEEQSYPL